MKKPLLADYSEHLERQRLGVQRIMESIQVLGGYDIRSREVRPFPSPPQALILPYF